MPISLIKVHPAVMTKRCLKDQVPFYLNDHGFAVKKKIPSAANCNRKLDYFSVPIKSKPILEYNLHDHLAELDGLAWWLKLVLDCVFHWQGTVSTET